MEAEQAEEWKRLQETAHGLLRAGTTERVPGTQRLLQVLRLPSFHDGVSWELFRVGGDNDAYRYCLVQTVWRYSVDLEKFATPVVRLSHPRHLEPTLERRTVALEANRIQKLLGRLEKASIPLTTTEAPVGLDGTLYELCVGEYFHTGRLTWWEEGPDAWRPLTDLVRAWVDQLPSPSGNCDNG